MTVFGEGVFPSRGQLPFIGATSSVAGNSGAVPAPQAGDQNKYVKGDGTFAAITINTVSPSTTKGDMIVYDGANNVRLPAAADGYLLQSDSTSPLGVSYVANPAGAYDTMENAGSPLTLRNTVNFSGSGITAVDNAPFSRTDISLSGTLVDIAGLTPTAHTVVYGNGTHFTNASTATTNTYYISKNGNDTTGDGSVNFPYLTIGAACTAIGNAADSTAFNDTTKRYYTIYIDAGIYVENVTIPSRPDLTFDMHCSVIQGNVTQDLDRTLLAGALNTAKVSVIGYDMRGAHSGLSLPKIGVDGNLTMTSSVGANNFTSLYLINTGVTGDVLFSGVNPGYQGFLFTQNTNISGSINTSGTGVNINMYLNQAATSGTAGIGGCNGFVNFSAVNNINFNGPVITNTNQAGRLWNTQFKSGQAHNFTGATGTFTMDANTYDSYFNNVSTKGGETIALMDTARGVNASYVPSNYSATSADIRGNLQGIDNALATIAQGLTVKTACYAATTAALTATYSNGTSGVGATLTNSGAQAAFSLDGTTPPINSRILIKNQASTFQNGIYTLTTVGSGASNWVLTRTTDYNTAPSEIFPGNLIIVDNGTANGISSWVETAIVNTIGTDAIVFSQFTSSPSNFLLSTNNLSDVSSASTSRTNLGLAIGTNVQAHGTALDNITAGTYTGASSITTLGTVTTGTLACSLSTYTETLFTTNSGSSFALDCSASHNWLITLTANCTFTVTNVPASGITSLNITLIQGAGPFTVTWPASFIWGGGTAPTLTTTSGHVDEFVARTTNAGTNFRAFTAGQNFSS